jgi:hypothetical protein
MHGGKHIASRDLQLTSTMPVSEYAYSRCTDSISRADTRTTMKNVSRSSRMAHQLTVLVAVLEYLRRAVGGKKRGFDDPAHFEPS